MNSILTALKSYGLTHREALVYQYLLQKPWVSAYTAANDLSLPRATMYKVFDSLIRQQLVSRFRKNNKLYFSLESTSQLLANLETKQRSIERTLPSMQHLIEQSMTHDPSARFYTGEKGVKLVWENILEVLKRNKIKVVYAATHSRVFSLFPKYFGDWLIRRETLKVTAKLIYPFEDKKSAPPLNKFLERRFLTGGFTFVGDMTIYGDRIALFSPHEQDLHSVIIDSKALTQIVRNLFLYVWNTLPKED